MENQGSYLTLRDSSGDGHSSSSSSSSVAVVILEVHYSSTL